MKKFFCLLMALVLTVSCLSGASFGATVYATVTTGSTVVNATSISAMVSAVSSTGTSVVTLKRDISQGAVIVFPYSCTIDLNGFTMSTTSESCCVVRAAGSQNPVTYIKNGVIDGGASGIRVEKGALNMQNVIICGRSALAVNLKNTLSNYASLNRIEDCTLVCSTDAALGFNNSIARNGAACTLKNSTLISAKPSTNNYSPVIYAPESGSGSVTLEEGVRIYHYTPLVRHAGENARNDHYWRSDTVETLGLTARAEHRFTDIVIPELGLTLEGLDGWYSYSQPAGTDVEKLQQAVVETALAYYRKGSYMQYDFAHMTWQSRYNLGVSRMNTGSAPEDAAYDFTVNTNCSDWACDIYLNAFDYAPSGSRRHNQVRYLIKNKRDTDADVIFRYFANKGDSMPQTVKNQIPGLRDQLQPGDLINVMIPAGGHTMIYIGDYKGDGNKYFIHSTGGGTPLTDENGKVPGKDSINASGTLSIVNINRLFEASYNHSYYLLDDGVYQLSIVRPLNLLSEADLTPSALSRLQYPGLDIDRSASAPLYSSVEPGSQITVTLTLKNTGSKKITGLQVSELLPEGVELVADSAAGATVSENKLDWTVSITAGSTLTLSYRVRVTANPGQNVTLPGGTVADIPTRDLRFTVLGSPLVMDSAAFAAAAKKTYTQGDSAFANAFYKNALDLELNIPSVNQLMENLFTQEPQEDMRSEALGGMMLVAKDRSQLTAEYQRIYDMILPDHQAGQSVYIPVDLECGAPEGRVSTYLETNYMPGDIFLCTEGQSYLNVADPNDVVVYIYLGGDRVAVWDATGNAKGTGEKTSKGFQIMSFMDTIHRNLRLNLMLCLRPALVEDLITVALWQHGSEVVECGSLSKAASLITEDGKSTITLQRDITENHSVALSAPYSFTLDLNGHTLTSPTHNAVVVSVNGNSVTTVKNGTIIGSPFALRINGGGVHVEDAVLRSTGGATMGLYTTTADWNSENLVERSVLLSDIYYAFSFHNTSDQSAASITIRDSDLITAKADKDVLNTRTGGTVILESGVNLYAVKTTGYYNSKLTISGETVTKASGTHTVSVPELNYSRAGLTLWKTASTRRTFPGATLPDGSIAWAVVYDTYGRQVWMGSAQTFRGTVGVTLPSEVEAKTAACTLFVLADGTLAPLSRPVSSTQ